MGASPPTASPSPPALPDEAWVTALATLELMGPARLSQLLDQWPPAEAFAAATGADLPRVASPALRLALGAGADQVVARWREQGGRLDVAALWQRHLDAGTGVALRTSPAYPSAFAHDPEPPPIVFFLGDPDALVGPRVAIVGTRSCTRYGFDLSRQLGADLAAAGVGVVSGLALGVDGAAHEGALLRGGAPPIAVVGSGLDRVYPRRNQRLWRRVAEAGVVLSEYPLGSPPLAWHFPARNRLIAGLADIVVVVESAEVGGSMLTVDEAIVRDIDVMAVPGPVTSPSSAGTNRLLAEGRGAVRDAVDVLVALGMSDGSRRPTQEMRPTPDEQGRAVLAALDWQPATFDQLVLRTGLDLGPLTLALDRLAADRWVERRGGWYERVAKPEG